MAIDAVEYPLNTTANGARKLGASIEAAVTILTNFNGNETVNRNRSQLRRVFNATYGVRSLLHLQILATFFHAMGGPETGFLIKDWTDFKTTRTVTTLASGITTQGTATVISGATWQLEKKYTVGARSHSRKIKRPKQGTVQVWFDGTGPKTEGVDYSIDYTTGVLTVLIGTPAAITWTGEFFVPCRFAEKSLPADLLLYRTADDTGHAELPQVPMIEIL